MYAESLALFLHEFPGSWKFKYNIRGEVELFWEYPQVAAASSDENLFSQLEHN